MNASTTRTGPRFTTSFAEVRADVAEVMGHIVYATMTTVDRLGRPRARVLIAVWELEDEVPVGWLGTFKTPVKSAHIAHNPHVTLSYWSPRQDVVSLDTVAGWVDDPGTREKVWSLYVHGSPRSVGYDPAPYWPGGPNDPGFHVLRLDPWRVQVHRAYELARGVPSRIWQAEERTRA
jgi:general stress protein 26